MDSSQPIKYGTWTVESSGLLYKGLVMAFAP
jgi:hypothetical protein